MDWYERLHAILGYKEADSGLTMPIIKKEFMYGHRLPRWPMFQWKSLGRQKLRDKTNYMLL